MLFAICVQNTKLVLDFYRKSLARIGLFLLYNAVLFLFAHFLHNHMHLHHNVPFIFLVMLIFKIPFQMLLCNVKMLNLILKGFSCFLCLHTQT